MVAAINQDFVTYRGDTVKPIFAVVDSSGNPVDISGATQIAWSCRLNLDGSPLISKTKTGGQIAFVNTGVDGKFQVTILPTDTQPLSGFYIHAAVITDSVGNVSTVEVGRIQVGIAPAWTYNPMEIANSTLYQTRLLIGDILQGDQQMTDAEINYFVTKYSNVTLAAAACCRHLATRYARAVDIVQATLKTNYSNKSKQYFALSQDMEQRGYATAIGGYAGGISREDVLTQQQNTDRVQPEFTIGMSDNFLPIGPIGVEQPLGNTTAGLGGDTGSV
jgi:hypothetical protein